MKNIFSLILSVIAINGYAQINPTDSVLKNATLKEVLINGGEKDKSTEAFNFYRSSKISSTEDILSRIEGVNLIKRGPFGMEPTLRSYSAGQLNITINGMRMYGACTDKMDPVSSYVEPGNLSTLQVNQGAGQSLMNSTIGGSINFELKEAQINCHKPVLLNAHSQYSSINNALNTGFNLNLSGAKVATRISATYRNAQNYYGGNHTLVKYSSYEKLNTSLGIAAQLNANNTLLADVITDQGLNIGYPALPMDVSSVKAFITSITHRKVFKSNKASFIETKLYYNTITHLMDDTKRPETIIHMDMPGWSNTLGFYSKLQLVKIF
jgi:iron complex outermembrane receptor protein